MYVRLRIKLSELELTTLKVDLPSDLRDYHEDTIDDFVSDWLDDKGVEYKWCRVLHKEEPQTFHCKETEELGEKYMACIKQCDLCRDYEESEK